MSKARFDNPFIVVGTGRCGTSNTARVLHEVLGVHMGNNFLPKPNPANPIGGWEDADFYTLHHRLIKSQISWNYFRRQSERLVGAKQSYERLWGFKECRMADSLLGHYLTLFEAPRIIWCRRGLEECARSFANNFFKPYERQLAIVKKRELAIERLLRGRGYAEIWYCTSEDNRTGERLSDKYVADKIRSKQTWELMG